MNIVCISDTHMHHNKIKFDNPFYYGDIDVLIHAGDFTYHGETEEVVRFMKWYGQQNAKHKLLICGNHEVGISRHMDLLRDICKDNGIILLHNSHVVIDGVKFFGSPYSVKFGNWAFGVTEEELQSIWDHIDSDVNVLITHGPAYRRLDYCRNGNVGSVTLAKHIDSKLKDLKLHFTGHIHESRGIMVHDKYITVNAAICGIPYTDVKIDPIKIKL